MSRFSHIIYDAASLSQQGAFKQTVEELSTHLEAQPNGRYKALALTSLEEAYMWIGKMIRDEQLAREAQAAAK